MAPDSSGQVGADTQGPFRDRVHIPFLHPWDAHTKARSTALPLGAGGKHSFKSFHKLVLATGLQQNNELRAVL